MKIKKIFYINTIKTPVTPKGSDSRQAGFSLMMVSLMLTVASLILVASLPGNEAPLAKAQNSTLKLQKIETAMTGFMAKNHRRPCPADGQSALNTANFGVEAANPGTCTGGTPTAPLGPDAATGHIVSGTIPTRALGLDDSYAFDAWGRRLTYVVDKRATSHFTCNALQIQPGASSYGDIKIEATNGGTVLDNVMAAYISHGQSGYGAWPGQGAVDPAHRLNNGSGDIDKQTNAGVDAAGASSTFTYNTSNFTNVRVKKEATPTFDDIVYYSPYQKNTCCVGPGCTANAARFDGQSANDYVANNGIKSGNISGNGKQDLVIATYNTSYAGTTAGSIYVLLDPSPASIPAMLNMLSTGSGNMLDGIKGFRIDGVNSRFASSITVGDVNNDGSDDILVASGSSGARVAWVIWGGRTAFWSATQSIDTLVSLGYAMRINGDTTDTGSGFGNYITLGDVTGHGNGIKDIIISDSAASPNGLAGAGSVYVLYGGATKGDGVAWTSPQTVGNNFLNGEVAAGNITFSANPTNGQTITLNGTVWTFVSGAAAGNQTHIGSSLGNTMAALAGDLNASVLGTLTVAGYTSTTTQLRINYKTFGTAGNSYSLAASAATPSGGTLSGGLAARNGFRLDGSVAALGLGPLGAPVDVNNDGIPDMIIGNNAANITGSNRGTVYVVFGGPTMKNGDPWAATQKVDTTLLDGGGTAVNGFVMVGETLSNFLGTNIVSGDFNGDGINDIGIGDYSELNIVWGKSSGWATQQVLSAAFLATANPSGGNATGNITFASNPTYSQSLTINGSPWAFTTDASSFQQTHVGATLSATLTQLAYDLNTTSDTNVNVASYSATQTQLIVTYKTTGVGGNSFTLAASDATPSGPNLTGGAGTNGVRFTGVGGGAMSLGDVNGDGIADLVVGNSAASPGGRSSAGSTYVVYGKKGTWAATQTLTSAASIEFDGAVAGEQSGYSTAITHISSPFYSDILIGAPQANPNSVSQAGSAYMIYGQPQSKWTNSPYNLGDMLQ